MANQKCPLDMMLEAFFPIVMKDPDIVQFIKESDLDEEGVKTVVFYLTASAAGMYLATLDRERFDEDIRKAAKIAGGAVNELSERCEEDVSPILMRVLKENIDEWFEIMGGMMKKARMEEEDDDTASADDKPSKIVTAFGKVLLPIVLREDDVTEFMEEYHESARQDIVNFIVVIVLLNWASHYQQSEGEADDPIAQNADALVDLLKRSVNSYAKHFQEHLEEEDFKEFVEKVNEIVEDHLREFVKKMYKAIAKINAENR